MCISSPGIKWVGNRNRRRNRKSIFGNDLLQGTQSNVGFSATAVTVGFFGHNCPFFHITRLNHYAAFYVLSSFEQKERLPTNATFQLIPLFC